MLKIQDIEIPEPGREEILIKVHASTVNRTDCGFLRGEPKFARAIMGLRTPKNPILGCEFAGEIAGVGPGVSSFGLDDRVFGFSDTRFGGHGEYLVMAQDAMVATIPEHMTFQEAAPCTEGARYALNDIRKADVGPGQHVLIYGATGAIGSAAVQLSKFFGARVSAACNSKDMILVESLGADEVIDRTKLDLTGITRRYDFVFDAVGKLSYRQVKPTLTPRGLYCSTDLGPFPQNPILAMTTRFSRGRRVIFPIPRVNVCASWLQI